MATVVGEVFRSLDATPFPPFPEKRRRKKSGERNGANAKWGNASNVQPMQGKKKKTKKQIKVQDLKPRKDVKGGMPHGPPHDVKWILKHLQLGDGPGSGGKTGANSPL